MDMTLGIAGLVAGVVIGYLLALLTREKPEAPASTTGETDWWELRKTLTGTQLQILQFMEARRSASIAALQEKFSFIPDRELYYRLEQIVLMGFVHRDRKDGEVVYTLNPDYQGRVEDDKTVMMSGS